VLHAVGHAAHLEWFERIYCPLATACPRARRVWRHTVEWVVLPTVCCEVESVD
jgi:hypothetical protein